MSSRPAYLPLPALTMEADGTPVSLQFGDVYFSRGGGALETEHVFLQGNGLCERWIERPRFTIGELGFGSGLNFLTAWKRFLTTAPPSHHLHYVSFEQFPFTPEMLARTHGADPLAQKLIDYYPLRLPGLHRIHFERVTLTLAFGDARELMPSLDGGTIDAWFLDGFAPAKNPELWGEDILREIARLSAADATFATYTAASAVRRGLEAHGFMVEKVRGFGKKREMLIGRFATGGASAPATARGSAFGLRAAQTNAEALIIGGGIAGCTAARAMAERGMRVTLLEKNALAAGASGNPAGVLYPHITKTWLPATAWHFAAYSYTLRRLKRWKEEGLTFEFDSPGMVKLAMREDERVRFGHMHERLGLDASIAEWHDAATLSKKLGFTVERDGAWFPHGSWVRPVELCRALVAHDAIALREGCAVNTLVQTADGWAAHLADGTIIEAPNVVIAAAHEAATFVPELTLGRTAGQISLITTGNAAVPLAPIVSHTGYVVPQQDHYLIGATYDHHDTSCAVAEANHAHNLAELKAALPHWNSDTRVVGGRASLRATTPDRLPYVGTVARGLYVSTGFGSRGMISAPLAAEVIASMIAGDVVPLTAELKRTVAPLRRQTASSSVRANPSRANIAS